MTLAYGDNGKIVEARPGDSVVVRLNENPTTGFVWGVDKGSQDILPLLNSDYQVNAGARVGGGGQRTLTFKVHKAGTLKLRLKLWREWEGDSSVADRFAVTLHVED